jgi:hypothetical protein
MGFGITNGFVIVLAEAFQTGPTRGANSSDLDAWLEKVGALGELKRYHRRGTTIPPGGRCGGSLLPRA